MNNKSSNQKYLEYTIQIKIDIQVKKRIEKIETRKKIRGK